MRLVVLCLLVLTGCVSSNYMQVGQKTYPPRPDDWIVDVFVGVDAPVIVHQSIENAKSTDAIPAGAEMIGRVDTAGGEWASWNSVINDASRKARALGGDGLVIGRWGSFMTGIDNWGGAHYGKALSFSVIRYRN